MIIFFPFVKRERLLVFVFHLGLNQLMDILVYPVVSNH